MTTLKHDNVAVKTVDTFTATIYCGTFNDYTQCITPVNHLKYVCRDFCDEVGLCVSVKEVDFIYTGGQENGISATIIHYPRFPREYPESEIRKLAIQLAGKLKKTAGQKRVSIVFPNKTMMLESDDE